MALKCHVLTPLVESCACLAQDKLMVFDRLPLRSGLRSNPSLSMLAASLVVVARTFVRTFVRLLSTTLVHHHFVASVSNKPPPLPFDPPCDKHAEGLCCTREAATKAWSHLIEHEYSFLPLPPPPTRVVNLVIA